MKKKIFPIRLIFLLTTAFLIMSGCKKNTFEYLFSKLPLHIHVCLDTKENISQDKVLNNVRDILKSKYPDSEEGKHYRLSGPSVKPGIFREGHLNSMKALERFRGEIDFSSRTPFAVLIFRFSSTIDPKVVDIMLLSKDKNYIRTGRNPQEFSSGNPFSKSGFLNIAEAAKAGENGPGMFMFYQRKDFPSKVITNTVYITNTPAPPPPVPTGLPYQKAARYTVFDDIKEITKPFIVIQKIENIIENGEINYDLFLSGVSLDKYKTMSDTGKSFLSSLQELDQSSKNRENRQKKGKRYISNFIHTIKDKNLEDLVFLKTESGHYKSQSVKNKFHFYRYVSTGEISIRLLLGPVNTQDEMKQLKSILNQRKIEYDPRPVYVSELR